jgi:broad specificity phosphatase PhoE
MVDAKVSKVKSPNHGFKERYTEEVMARCPILMIRHAYSLYNHAISDFKEKGKEGHHDYLKLNASKDLIDPTLHSVGI